MEEKEQRLFIFNHRISSEQIAVFALDVAEDQDILGSWSDWNSFTAETGLTADAVGSLVKNADGTIVSSDVRRAETIELAKPLLTGKTLITYLRELFSNLTLKQRATLLSPLVPIFDIIERDTSFTEIEFVDALDTVQEIAEQTEVLNSEQRTIIHNQLVNWAKDFKFAKEG
jgi:hypothetical protein